MSLGEYLSKRVNLKGISFHYLDWGRQGRTLVLLHGLASNAVFWGLTAPYLSEHFRVLALDQRGHGSSAKPNEGYDFASIVGDLRAFIEGLDMGEPIVVGHSWGGNVAVQAAVDCPDLISGIACVDGGIIDPALAPGATWESTAKALEPPDFVGMDLTWEELLRQSTSAWGSARYWGDALPAFLRANFETDANGKVRPRLTRDRHMRIVREIWDQRVTSLYPSIRRPALIMPARGAEPAKGSRLSDFNNHKESVVAMAQRCIEKSRVIWMENSIHDVPVQRPREVAEAIIDAWKGGFFE